MRAWASFASLSAALAGCRERAHPLNRRRHNSPPRPPPGATFATRSSTATSSSIRASPSRQGRHEFDGQIGDWSDAGLARRIAFLRAAVDGAATFDAAQLSAADGFERDYLVHVARRELFWLEDADQPHTNLTWYFDNGLDPNVYIARPYADAATRLRAFIAYARAVPAALAQIRANLRTPMPLSFVEYGIAGFNGFADYYRGDVKAAFAAVDDRGAAGGARRRHRDGRGRHDGRGRVARAATRDGDAGLRARRRALRAHARSDRGRHRSRSTSSRRSAARISARNQEALRSACATFAPDATLGECMTRMDAAKSPLGPVAEARTQLPALKQFLLDTDLVSIPGTEEALVEEAPPYNRQNSAYIDIPGPYETGMPSVYYIAPPDPSWTPEEQAAYIPGTKNLLFTSVHEVWPGHFLNFLHANRAPSLFGRVFVGYAFAEGWAHYAEELVWEAGLRERQRRDAASASSRTPCCATAAICPRSACTRAA